jgi:sugar O-acyltransferase (sialic acid O-acetyltransferase NeuD family)
VSAIHIIGAGGHAKVVVGALVSSGATIAGLYDDNPSRRGGFIMGVPVVGSCSDFAKVGAARAIIAIGSNAARRKIASLNPAAEWVHAFHRTAWVDASARVGQGSVVFAGAVVQPDAVIGAHCIINTSATVDHDCVIRDFVHLAPGVHLAGDVSIEEGAFLGVGACVIPGIKIGRGAVVGAGAVVIRDVRDGATVIGVPAREISTHAV